MSFDTVLEAVEAAEAAGVSLGELALRNEAEQGLRTRAEVENGLQRALDDAAIHQLVKGVVDRP